ncbi:hypothetical protein OUZ56_002045 [Daphnia magna]|uniref:Uncharacterized protein n=1 Tax=Daphnia magna TaxID=35525 RepID=A0ABR0A4Y2_9CRUS|nr:hypothetical protein OUZ56_002045 [Daphnia magna]
MVAGITEQKKLSLSTSRHASSRVYRFPHSAHYLVVSLVFSPDCQSAGSLQRFMYTTEIFSPSVKRSVDPSTIPPLLGRSSLYAVYLSLALCYATSAGSALLGFTAASGHLSSITPTLHSCLRF